MSDREWGCGNPVRDPKNHMITKPGENFQPFKGDSVLSLVVRRALRLAADDRITDASITRQIRG